MKFMDEDFKKYQMLSFHLEKNVEWKVDTQGILEVNSCIQWFNQVGNTMKAEILADRADAEAKAKAAEEAKAKAEAEKAKAVLEPSKLKTLK